MRYCREYDKLAEATHYLCRAWRIARELHSEPCIGLVLGRDGDISVLLRPALWVITSRYSPTQPDIPKQRSSTRQRLLAHARIDLERALNLERLEMETRLRALLALGSGFIAEHKREEAEALLTQVRADARRYELVQIEEQANKLLRTS